jgi:RimJ/RimL family protein N-acetyltransferase
MSTLPRSGLPLTDGTVDLRPFTLDDVPAVTAACQDPEISRWTASIPSPYEDEDARTWISAHDAQWERGAAAEFAVTAAVGGRLLGALGLHPFDWDHGSASVGYWVVATERGQGVATRALRLGVNWAFRSLSLTSVGLVTMIGNVASEGVAEKAGFRMVEEITDYRHPFGPDRLYRVKRWTREPER